MEGYWNIGPIYKIYYSNTRSMARFGLLALNKGKWKNEQIIPNIYFEECINSSQNINPSYGYLWWLNGKSSFMAPGSQVVYPSKLLQYAPNDTYVAMGADEQRIYIIPTKNMVIIRMGEATDPAIPSLSINGFDNQFWQKLNAVIN